MPNPTRPASRLDTSRSAALHREALDVLPGGTSRSVHQTTPHPIYAREGAGSVVTDVDGNRYVDFYNNASALIHGHAHPGIVAAIEAQARRGTAFSLAVEGQIELARMLVERIDSAEQVRFVNSGTEAVMLAAQVARALTGKPAIAKFEGLYHGSADAVEVSLDPSPETWGGASAPASVGYTRATPPGLLDSVVVLPYNDADAAEAILTANAHRIGGLLLDVLPLRLGLTPADRAWVAAIRRLTRDLGILLISDEVVSFRIDYGGAQAAYEYSADLTVLGKVIGGGLPVGAVAGPRDVMAAFDGSAGRAAVPNAGTFNANPLTLAAGTAALQALPRTEIERINGLGDQLRSGVQAVFASAGLSAHASGIGSLFGIHLTGERFTDYRGYWQARVADPGVKARQRALYDGLRERGILLTTEGVGAISTAMDTDTVGAFVAAVAEIVAELPAGDAR